MVKISFKKSEKKCRRDEGFSLLIFGKSEMMMIHRHTHIERPSLQEEFVHEFFGGD